MKIVKLTAENIKRLTAVEITPEGNVITVGGKNGAGKSSVLDSISYALGGSALVPGEPIRKGENEAKVEIDLDDLVVTRKFHYLFFACNCEAEPHERLCDSFKPPTLQSSLTVRSKSGVKVNSPQRLLDSLLGRLSFDPLEFVSSKQQASILRDLVGLDTSVLDQKRSEAYQHRSEFNKRTKEPIPYEKHGGVPDKEIPTEEITRMMGEAEEKREEGNSLNRKCEELTANESECQRDLNRSLQLVGVLREKVKVEEKRASIIRANLAKSKDELTAIEERVSKFEFPRTEELQKKIKEIDDTNRKVRENKLFAETLVDRLNAESSAATESEIIKKIDQQKKEMLEKAKFPVEGLSIEKDEVFFNEIPFNQTSTAEKLRISVAIGIALNPELKILLVREGSSLDSNSLKAVAEQASEADAQLWLERVSESKDGITVMIEDGSIV